MHRSQKASVLAASAAAAALMILPRVEGAQTQPAIKTGDHIEVPAQTRPGDFDQTIVGQAPLQSEAASDACFTQAVSALATQRAALQRQCSEGDGQFNTGTLTAGLHRDSCTVSQMVTCTGTAAARDEEARKRASAKPTKTAAETRSAKARDSDPQ